ncbi:hypothetical protein [Blastomonas sp.]|uniref:hypothetical protein n=1 Tax=Blastomonas sp. TaxID=1909299 RepID=UPI00391D8AB4
MSKVFKVVGIVAGVVGAIALTAGTLGVGSVATAALLTKIGTLASVAAAAASVGAAVTAKPPPAQGAVNETTIGANLPAPYLMGETYSGMSIVHEAGWGAPLKKVKNPYYFRACTASICGPLAALVGIYGDFVEIPFSGNAATGFYSGFLYADVQLGATPESSALAPQWAGCPSWGADYKLSGHGAIGFSLLFDKEGERFASGQPQFGAIWRGVRVYDPRLDDTYPGGAGDCRIDDESTWVYSENPALHALTYAYGRYANGKKVFGVDLGDASIDVAGAVAWANLCDANNWKLGGTIYEPGDKWGNLKWICQAGGCEPVLAGGMLRWRWQRPHVSLRTITADDLARPDSESASNQSWKRRRNTIIPAWRSAANKWDYVQSAPISREEWLDEDGEPKELEQQFKLVQNANQAAQLGAYQIAEEREAGLIQLVLKPEFRTYDPGDGLTIDIGDHDLDMVPAILVSRSVAPDTGEVSMSFMPRDPGVDAWALAQTGTGPAASPVTSPEELDIAAGNNQNPDGYGSVLIANSSVANAGGVGGVNPVSAIDAGGDATIEIDVHDRIYADRTVVCDPGSITGAAYSTAYLVFYDDGDRLGGAVTYQATTVTADAFNSPTHPDRHFVGYVTTPAMGGGATTGGGAGPPGSGGGPIP